jgi:hypothetical protein
MARPQLYKCKSKNKTYAIPVDYWDEVDTAIRKVLKKYLLKPAKK